MTKLRKQYEIEPKGKRGSFTLWRLNSDGEREKRVQDWKPKPTSQLPHDMLHRIAEEIKAHLKSARSSEQELKKAKLAVQSMAAAFGCEVIASSKADVVWKCLGVILFAFQIHPGRFVRSKSVNRRRLQRLQKSKARYRFAIMVKGMWVRVEGQWTRRQGVRGV